MLNIVIIGGGASGMAAAIQAARDPKNRVTLLERQSRVGRKLLATGNGRCNLSNLHAAPEHYHGADPGFVRCALERFSVKDTMEFFQNLGLLTVTEPSGKIYPFSDQAGSVVDVLRFALQERGVSVRCGCEVLSLGKKAKGFQVKTAEEAFYADKVILSCGGAAGGKLGGTDWGYRLLSIMGHSRTPLRPCLVQIKTDCSVTRSLKGVRAVIIEVLSLLLCQFIVSLIIIIMIQDTHISAKPALNAAGYGRFSTAGTAGNANGQGFSFHAARIIKTISKGVVLIISPSLKKLYCRSSYLLYNQNKHCGFVFHSLRLRLVGGDSNRSGLSELVISWVTLDVLFA